MLLQNRIQTRISQALGRCVRSSNDYALILMVGEGLGNFCSKHEVLNSFHPELQAEIDFGLKNSVTKEINLEDFAKMAEIFFQQGESWATVDSDIVSLREKAVRKQDASLEKLASVAIHEVAFSKASWKGDLETAQKHAQKVIDGLTGTNTISYRGWWYYLAGSIAWLRAKQKDDKAAYTQAADFFRHSVNSISTISWLVQLQSLAAESSQPTIQAENDNLSLAQTVENLLLELSNFGRGAIKFERKVSLFEEQIHDNDSTNFELGVAQLGKLLGYSAERPNQDGGPDGVWEIPGRAYILLEAKSEQSADAPISKKDTLQTKGHKEWLKADREVPDNYRVISILITPRSELDELAHPHTEGVHLLPLEQVRIVADKVLSLHRELRSFAGDNFDEALLGERAAKKLKQSALDPEAMIAMLTSRRLTSLQTT